MGCELILISTVYLNICLISEVSYTKINGGGCNVYTTHRYAEFIKGMSIEDCEKLVKSINKRLTINSNEAK